MEAKPLNSVLIKPAGPDCNLRCSYCFYLKNANKFNSSLKHRMNEKTLEEVIQQVMIQGEQQVSFGWQGGEPTLMGQSFYERAVELQQRYGKNQSVANGLQTNGILIDRNWANFLKKYNFLVGLSIDGPEEIHNRYRLNSNGKGSWSRVVDNAKLLLDKGVAINALTVINDYSVSFPEEIYSFHKDLGLRFMQFIPCIEIDTSYKNRLAPFSLSGKKFGYFLCAMFDQWLDDFKDGQPTTSIRYFESLLYNYMEFDSPECTLKQTCGDYLVIEHNGNVYSCDFFVDPEWYVGNVFSKRLVDMLNSQRQQQFGLNKVILEEQCKSCCWLKYCFGGCPKDRINNPKNHKISAFCLSYQLFFKHADKRLRDLTSKIRNNNPLNMVDEGVKHRNQQRVGRNQTCPCGSGLKYKKCCDRKR